MDTNHALEIIDFMQKWRRGDYPFDENRSMPYSPREFGEAIDYVCAELQSAQMDLKLESQRVDHLLKFSLHLSSRDDIDRDMDSDHTEAMKERRARDDARAEDVNI